MMVPPDETGTCAEEAVDWFHGNAEGGILCAVNDCIVGISAYDSLWDRQEKCLTLKSCMPQ
jgi:hypothetical protein